MLAAHPSCLASVRQAAEPKTPPALEDRKQEASLHAGSGLGWEAGLASQPSSTGQQEVLGPTRGREGEVWREDGSAVWTQERAIALTAGQRDCAA